MTPLRKRLETGAILAAPGAPDALSAHLGFEAVYMTGLGATASRYAECGVDLVFADGIKTRAEVTAVAARVPGPKVVSLADGTDAATVTLDGLFHLPLCGDDAVCRPCRAAPGAGNPARGGPCRSHSRCCWRRR